MKRLLALLCVIVCLAALCIPAMAAQDDMVPIVVKVPDDWASANLYAWDMDGNAAASWPGTGMMKLDDGWYVGYMSLDMMYVIVNNGSGAQTADLELDWGELEDGVWITVASDNGAEISYSKQNSAKIPAYEDTFYTIHVGVPSDWQNCFVWAWDDNDVNAYPSWPGAEMTRDSEGWFVINVPASAKNFLVSTKTGTQTVDIKGNGKEQWVVLGDADSEGKLAATVTDKAPEGYTPPEPDGPPVVDTVTVHAYVPETWANANVWAWGDGPTNVYESWPGQPMTKGEDGWYTLEVPGFFNGIIINDGSSQTPDIAVEVGKELWIDVATDPLAPVVSYEAMETPKPPVEDEEPTTQPTTEAPSEETPSESKEPTETKGNQDSDDDSDNGGVNVGLIIGIVVAVVVVAAGAVAIILILKKKN